MRCATDGSDERAAKRAYLKVLETYYTQDDVREDEITTAAHTYSAVLAKSFGHKERTDNVVDYTFFAATTGAGFLVGNLPGLAVGILISAAGLAVHKVKPVQNLVWRLGQTKPKKWVNEMAPFETSATTSLFQMDPVKVQVVRQRVEPYDG